MSTIYVILLYLLFRTHTKIILN